MKSIMPDPEKSGGYESMVWVRVKDGKANACYGKDIKRKEDLAEEKKATCIDVSQLVGTERW